MLDKLLFPALVAGFALSLAACSGGSTNARIDYKKAEVTKPLEVPPDLTLPPAGGREMELPLLSAQGANGSATGMPAVLPQQTNVHVAGDDSQRWLVVAMSPEELWPKLKAFWPTVGLAVQRDDAAFGIMETDWAENRSDIKGGFFKGLFAKVFSRFDSAPTRDKYRLRLERGENGGSELYVTHYGVEEVVKSVSEGFNETKWQTRPSDPELANEILKRLMIYLGTPEAQAQALAVTETVGPHLQLVDEGGPALRLDEGFDRAWRRTGIALDRMGLVVEDRDRSNGLYYVSKVDLLEEEKQGWFSSLFSGDEKKKANSHYRIKVAGEGESSLVTLLDGEGNRLTTDNARALLERMREQMQ
ncbi:MAG TPA: outer membrane protein assembly factor BamC [Gammaproteobacteria bacterium]